jgi:hypothetical protein
MRTTFVLPVMLLACGNNPDSRESKTPSTGSSSSPSTTATSSPAEAAPSVSASASAEPEKPRGKPFELYNSCTKVVTVIVGKDPKSTDAGKRTAAPSSSIELPRDAAGNQIVWIADDKGEPTAVHVTVTRSMKRVEVGRSCSTLNAN